MTLLTEGRSEKYAKKLIGRMEMEDALKRLDKLTQEEVRMAAAQILKATHTVDGRVKGVADTAEAIDNKVASVDDRVVGVDNRVAGVEIQVAGVNDRVAAINDHVAGVNEMIITVDDRVKVVDNNVMQVIAGA